MTNDTVRTTKRPFCCCATSRYSSNDQPRKSHEGEHRKDFGRAPIYFTKATKLFTMYAAINSCNVGYDIGISTSVGEMIQEDLDVSDLARDVFIGSLHFWSIFGALASHFICDAYGRRRMFLVSNIFLGMGVLVMASATSYIWLMVGRMIMGLGVGSGLAIGPMYISEIAPAKGRGEMVTWTEIGLNVGILLGFSAGFFFSKLDDGIEWRAMFILGGLLPVLMIYLVLFQMPESPRWLLEQNQTLEAKRLFYKLYNRRIDPDHIIDNVRVCQLKQKLSKSTGWNALFHPTPSIARMLVIGIGLAIGQQAIGVDAIQHHLSDALDHAGIPSEFVQSALMIILSVVKIIFILLGGKASDIGGRRRQLFLSLLGMIVALLMLSFVFYGSSTESLLPRRVVVVDRRITITIIFGLSLYLSSYSLGVGPGTWLIPSEIFPIALRGKAMAIVTCINRITATVMSATYIVSANNDWISWSTFYLIFAMIGIVFAIFLYRYLPETKGRSLEDMSLYFAEMTEDETLLELERKVEEIQ